MKLHVKVFLSVSGLLLIELVMLFFFVKIWNTEKMERNIAISNEESLRYIHKRETNMSFFNFDDYTTAEPTNDKAEVKMSNNGMKERVPEAAFKKPVCNFFFDAKEIRDVRRDILQKQKEAAYLFYLEIMPSSNNDIFRNILEELLDWQIIDKSQKILGKLPVDFDIISLFLFEIDEEENSVQLNLYLNDSSCTVDEDTAVTKIQLLLWRELLNNDTDYYLCRRKIKVNYLREILYGITTIWLGYDLWCSSAPYDERDSYEILDKDMFYISSILCYLLSLQFIWIFSVLDVKYVKIGEVTGNEEFIPITSNKYERDKNLFSYRKFDKPSGPQRCILKSFFSKCTGCCRCCSSCRPERRLSIIFAIFITCIGLYCTISRFVNFYSIHQKNPYFVRASEPLITFLFKVNIILGFVFDILYCLISPILFAIFMPKFYRSFIKDDFTIYALTHELDKEDDSERPERKYKGLSNRFTVRWGKMSRMCDSCCARPSCDSLNPKCCCEFCAHLCLSFFPIFSFSHNHFISKVTDKEVQDNETQNNSSLNAENKDRIEIPELQKPLELGDTKVQQSEETAGQDYKCYIKSKSRRRLLIALFWFLAYLVVRPILSYVTFIFRVLTYFMFVTLPIRLNLFRYTLIVSTTIIYILKYLVNIVNLKSEILQYLFELKSQRRPTPSNTPECIVQIGEELYNEVSRELVIVRRGMHLFVMKSFIAVICCILLLEVFLATGISMSAVHTKEIIELALVLIGPYAISAFLKSSKENYLSEIHKQEISIAYEKYLKKNNLGSKRPLHKPERFKQKHKNEEQQPLVKDDQLEASSSSYGSTAV